MTQRHACIRTVWVWVLVKSGCLNPYLFPMLSIAFEQQCSHISTIFTSMGIGSVGS